MAMVTIVTDTLDDLPDSINTWTTKAESSFVH